MTRRTYIVHIDANALRTVLVRAESVAQAINIAAERVADTAGVWTIDFPGSQDEHFQVYLPDGRPATGQVLNEDTGFWEEMEME